MMINSMVGSFKFYKKIIKFIIFTVFTISLSGCLGTTLVVSSIIAVPAAVVSSSERGLLEGGKDLAIWFNIKNTVPKEYLSRVNVIIYEGRVLLVGKLETRQEQMALLEYIWRDTKVREVINEIIISKSTPEDDSYIKNATKYSKDTLITSMINSAIFAEKKIRLSNYKVTTYNSVVYILGIAADTEEMDTVLNIIRKTPMVKKVMSHIRTKDHPLRKQNEYPG